MKNALFGPLSKNFVHFILTRVEKVLKLFRVQVINRLNVSSLLGKIGHFCQVYFSN